MSLAPEDLAEIRRAIRETVREEVRDLLGSFAADELLETWEGIACGLPGGMVRSEKWCRDMAEREDNPMPIRYVGRTPTISRRALAAWVLGSRASGISR